MTPVIGPSQGFWGINPIVLAIFMLVVTHGLVNANAVMNEEFSRKGFWCFKSFVIGDGVLVPTYVGLSAYVFQHMTRPDRHSWFLRPELGLFLWLAAIAYAKWFEGPSVDDPFHKQNHVLHFGVAVVVFYVMVSAAVPLIWAIFWGHGVPLTLAVVAALCGAGHVFLGLVIDRDKVDARINRVIVWRLILKPYIEKNWDAIWTNELHLPVPPRS